MNEEIRKAIERLVGIDRKRSDEAAEAAKAIGKLGSVALCATLETPEALNVPGGRRTISAQLALQDPSDVSAALVGALAHPDWRPNQVAADAVGQMGDVVVSALIEGLEKEETAHGRGTMIMVLRRMGVVEACSILERLVTDDESADVRAAALEALGWLGAKAAGAAVALALDDESPVVRVKAVKTAGWLKAAEVVDGILEFLKSADAEGRAAAVYALDRIGLARATGQVVELLRDEDSYVRWSAAVALRRLWTDDCRGPLEAALSDEEDTVAAAALETLCIASPEASCDRTNDPTPAARRVAQCYASLKRA